MTADTTLTIRRALTAAVCALLVGGAFAHGEEKLPSFIVRSVKELKALQKKLAKAKAGSRDQAWLRWQLALNAPQVDQPDLALKALGDLAKSKQTLIGQDQIHLTRARVLFQMNRFREAVAEYQQVPKTSEYWFEALEEEAWSYIRMNEPDRATAKLTTLLSPVFNTWVGPETYYAANYIALKTCDYSAVFKNGKQFRDRHAERVRDLEQLSKNGANRFSEPARVRLESGEMNFMAFAKEAIGLPRFFWRDEFLRRHVAAIQTAKKKGETGEVARRQKEINQRLKALATAELSEYRTVIQKLHIIEAEVIQRLHMDESLKGERPEAPRLAQDADTLTFPYTDELWLDEIDSYRAQVKTCPELSEAKL